ncbi:MAG: diacylglycerol kinase family lipid kinase [Elusimicrobia bacterium]|nr:diacylglycerol kinase family lipid kinase [Elusimicrobiota bacterium]
MPSTLFILNSAAGHGRAASVWDSFREEALRALPDAACIRTEGPGHAGDLAQKAVESGSKRLIAIGGDGTFSEMLNGVMRVPLEQRRTVALAALPAGSGCDLARHLSYPADHQGLLELIVRGAGRGMDVGKISYSGLDGSGRERHFINIAAFGLAGEVAHLIHRMGKKLGGTLSYALASARALLTARAKTLRLTADGLDISGRYHLGVIANTSSMGGGMLVAPQAVDDDGVMELVLVSDMSRLRLWMNFPGLYRGTHLNEQGISLRGIKTLKAESDETVYLNIDGEADGMLPASFEILPKAVTVLVPSKTGLPGF